MEELSYHPPLPSPGFAPQTGRLITAGILLLLAGCFTGCISGLMPLALINPQLPPGQTRQMLIGLAMYGGITLILVWLGVGILLPRRWARPLILILATHWLIIGVLTVIGMLVMLPMMRDIFASGGGGPGVANVVLAVSLVVLLIGFVIWPLALLLLVRGDAARQTVEWKDTVTRWTDGCPMNVLGLVVTLCVVALFAIVGAAQPAVPILGLIVRQPFALVIGLLLAIVLIYAVVLAYRLRMSGWWLGLLAVLIPLLAYVPNAWLIPLSDFYAASGMQRQQIEPFLKHETALYAMMAIFPLIFAAAWLIYMLRLRPTFIAAQHRPAV